MLLKSCTLTFSHAVKSLLILTTTYTAHNALPDVQMLKKLASGFVSDDCILKHSLTPLWSKNNYQDFLDKKTENFSSVHPLIQAKVITKGMAEKVESSGLTFAHLHPTFQRDAADDINLRLVKKMIPNAP